MQTISTAQLSTTVYAVLGLLFDRERSGYDLKKAAESGVGYVWTPAKSQIYAVLPRLVEGGFATARHVPQERLPDKEVYAITKAGKAAFRAWLEEPVDYHSPRSPFLLKILFGAKMSREALLDHVEAKRKAASEDLAEFRAIEKAIGGSKTAWALRWGIAHEEAWIRWADEIIRELEEGP